MRLISKAIFLPSNSNVKNFRDYDATEYYGYSLMYFIDTPINNGNREQTKQGMLRSPVGAIAPGGSSCVSIFKKRIIGTAM